MCLLFCLEYKSSPKKPTRNDFLPSSDAGLTDLGPMS